MAWVRTALSMLAVSGAVVRLGVLDQAPAVIAVGAIGCLLCLGLVVVSSLRYRHARLLAAAGLDPRARWAVVVAVAAVTCVAVAALGLVLAAMLT
jgi:uncharacterized membrane protein YidH (DUF202 family)